MAWSLRWDPVRANRKGKAAIGGMIGKNHPMLIAEVPLKRTTIGVAIACLHHRCFSICVPGMEPSSQIQTPSCFHSFRLSIVSVDKRRALRHDTPGKGTIHGGPKSCVVLTLVCQPLLYVGTVTQAPERNPAEQTCTAGQRPDRSEVQCSARINLGTAISSKANSKREGCRILKKNFLLRKGRGKGSERQIVHSSRTNGPLFTLSFKAFRLSLQQPPLIQMLATLSTTEQAARRIRCLAVTVP